MCVTWCLKQPRVNLLLAALYIVLAMVRIISILTVSWEWEGFINTHVRVSYRKNVNLCWSGAREHGKEPVGQLASTGSSMYKDFCVQAWKESGKRWRRHLSNHEQVTVPRESGINKREQHSLDLSFLSERSGSSCWLKSNKSPPAQPWCMAGCAWKVVIVWWVSKGG